MSSSPNCKCPNMIPFHLPYKIPRTEGQKCSKSNQQQDRYTDFWPTSKLWQWKFTVRMRHLGTARQGRTNLKEKSSGSATGRGANLTSIWEGSGHTLLVFAATARNTYTVPSGMPRHPKLTAAPSGADTKSNNFALTSCLQAQLRTLCMPVLLDAFAILPYAPDCPKRKHIPG